MSDIFNAEIEKLISLLEQEKSQNPELLGKIQAKLDQLAEKYQQNESIGSNRYKLYQAQAMICYRRFEDDLAIEWMQEAINVKGESFKFADEFLNSVGQSAQESNVLVWGKKPSQRKRLSTRAWQFFVTLLVGLIFVALFNQVIGIVGIILLITLCFELVYVVGGKTTVIDKVFTTTTGKVIFWIAFIVILALAIYVPQKWGEWTRQSSHNIQTTDKMA